MARRLRLPVIADKITAGRYSGTVISHGPDHVVLMLEDPTKLSGDSFRSRYSNEELRMGARTGYINWEEMW